MESQPVKKRLTNDSLVKVTYSFESEEFKNGFVSAFFKMQGIKKFPIGQLQVNDNEPTIIIETRLENLCYIFYIIGAMAERCKNMDTISLN
ncbi:MAG: hypothetical protein LCH91_05300 [Bacteroidetes bacterium]|nr:hypothetical protein [Bacteroidota bacterium]